MMNRGRGLITLTRPAGQDSSVVTISDLFQMLYLRGDVSSTPLEAVNEAGVDVVWSPAAGQGPELDQCVVI